MKGLLKKDFFITFNSKYFLYILGYIGIILAASLVSKKTFITVLVGVILPLIIILGTIDNDQKGNVYTYLKGLPISNENIILSKFIFVFFIFLFCTLVTLLGIYFLKEMKVLDGNNLEIYLGFIVFLYFYLVTSGQIAISLTLDPSIRSLSFAIFGMLPPFIEKIIEKFDLISKENMMKLSSSFQTMEGRMKFTVILIILSLIILCIIYKISLKLLEENIK